MLVGYMRVSTADQDLGLQFDALKAAGCERFFEDKASGAKDDRKGLMQCLEFLRPSDTLVVWKLDRLGRSLKHLVQIIGELESQKIGFYSLTENVETTSDTGKLVFHIFASLAEFERSLVRERTKAGLRAARARGRKGGRPRVMDEKTLGMARTLMADAKHSVNEVCSMLEVSRATLYRAIKILPNK